MVDKPELLRARGGVWFEVGIGQLHIGVESSFSPARHLALRVPPAEIDTLATRLAGAGMRIDWDHDLREVRRFSPTIRGGTALS